MKGLKPEEGKSPKSKCKGGRTGANRQKEAKKGPSSELGFACVGMIELLCKAPHRIPVTSRPPPRPLHSSSTWPELPYLDFAFKDLASLPAFLPYLTLPYLF